ncbi:ParB/RepB/Spo0J family partition protein [Actinomadura atramentaria]|uniref:ParB/RepB/Spo0J family partition protein n=1 Tax=Actinomadura atramentaria TaxID=1990 RepID=UPI0012F8A206|nr:ParB/RepB/Spo0J family partition protein [Actinomadura atramentaria]
MSETDIDPDAPADIDIDICTSADGILEDQGGIEPETDHEPVAGESCSAGSTDGSQGGPALSPEELARFTERPMIPVAWLAAHPGNVREDKQADQAFCRSVASAGIITPLEIAPDPDRDGLRVVDGNIRLDAAMKVGLHEVPYFFSADAADDEGMQYLHMLITSRFRRDLSQKEEALALFHAHQQGLTRTEIRRRTGLGREQVKAGIRVGGLNGTALQIAESLSYDTDLQELALLAPYQDDPEALEYIAGASTYSPLKYVIQRLEDKRKAAKRRAELVAELEAAGLALTDERPDGAVALHRLLDDEGEQEMTVEAHADCPGRGAWLPAWSGATPNHYCLDPEQYGHRFADTGTTTPPEPAVLPRGGSAPTKASTERAIVIEGNAAWSAAGMVRREWLAEFLKRKTAPRDVAAVISRFVTTQIVTMPEALRRALGSASSTDLFRTFGDPAPETVAKSTLPGLWMLLLVPIATAYEREITGDGERRNTWRDDKYSPIEREDAGAWLRFIAEIGAKHGYELSPIERAVADGAPYRGDNPTDNTADEPATETDDDCDDGAGVDASTDEPTDADAQAPDPSRFDDLEEPDSDEQTAEEAPQEPASEADAEEAAPWPTGGDAPTPQPSATDDDLVMHEPTAAAA